MRDFQVGGASLAGDDLHLVLRLRFGGGGFIIEHVNLLANPTLEFLRRLIYSQFCGTEFALHDPIWITHHVFYTLTALPGLGRSPRTVASGRVLKVASSQLASVVIVGAVVSAEAVGTQTVGIIEAAWGSSAGRY